MRGNSGGDAQDWYNVICSNPNTGAGTNMSVRSGQNQTIVNDLTLSGSAGGTGGYAGLWSGNENNTITVSGNLLIQDGGLFGRADQKTDYIMGSISISSGGEYLATSGTGVPGALTIDINSVDANGGITGITINTTAASATDNAIASIDGGGGSGACL